MRGSPASFIALRYLAGRAKEGGRYLRGAAAGIALSLVPIVVTLIVSDGMIRGITDRYLELGTGHIQVYNYFDRANPQDARLLIEGMEGVRGVWEERHGLGVLLGRNGSQGTTIRAVEAGFLADPSAAQYLEVLAGSGALEGDDEVLLGEELARAVGAEPGGRVRVMTMRTTEDGRGVPRVTLFTVKGIVSSGYRELDALWCLTSLEAGKKILAPEASDAFLTVKIDDPYGGVEDLGLALYQMLGYGYGIYTWQSLQRAQYSSYESTRQLLLFIMALIVLVAAVNVSSATAMLAIDRRRDIAIFKTGGMGAGLCRRIFLWGSFLTGGIGAVIGIAAGLAIGVNINALIRGLEAVSRWFAAVFLGGPREGAASYYLQRIPVIVDWRAVLLIGIFTVLCSCLASWIPARRAGKLKPVEVLRKY
ncbi:MAG: ABC transporter permease [Treponema sp.]|jgi:lipoprotein-releasing system permease protein|nr:ABC transporter permease [Treponema sp.]